MLIVNTAFYIYDNIILKEISIMNSFEQIQENSLSGSVFWLGSAFLARLGSSAVAFIPDHNQFRKHNNLAVFRSGCFVPISFLICIATLASSSLNKHRRLINDVGYPTIFSASETALFHSDALVELQIAKFRYRFNFALEFRGKPSKTWFNINFEYMFRLSFNIWLCKTSSINA